MTNRANQIVHAKWGSAGFNAAHQFDNYAPCWSDEADGTNWPESETVSAFIPENICRDLAHSIQENMLTDRRKWLASTALLHAACYLELGADCWRFSSHPTEELMRSPKWLLQTYYFWHELEERGFSRQFDSLEDAEKFARNNVCGSRHTITPIYPCEY